MDRDQDVEVELYEENVGNLNYSTNSAESRSSSPDRFLPVLSSQEPTQRRLEEIPFVAIDPRPDPEELSDAPTSQVPRIHDSCHMRSLYKSTLSVCLSVCPSVRPSIHPSHSIYLSILTFSNENVTLNMTKASVTYVRSAIATTFPSVCLSVMRVNCE